VTESLRFPLFIGIGLRGGLFLAGAVATAYPLSAATPRLAPLAAAEAHDARTGGGLDQPRTQPRALSSFSARAKRGVAAVR
jgi:hypothetical protein